MPLDDDGPIKFSEIYVSEMGTTWKVAPGYVSIAGYTTKTVYESPWIRFVRWFRR